MLWVRNDLHFQHGKAEDVLERTEQLRIAEIRKYPAVAGLLPVEQFMREYFQHTSDVREIAAHLAAGAEHEDAVLVVCRDARLAISLRAIFASGPTIDFGDAPRA